MSEAQQYLNTTLHTIADEYRASSSTSQPSPIPTLHRPKPSLPPDSAADIGVTTSPTSTGVPTTVSSTVPGSTISRPNADLTANASPAAVTTNQSRQIKSSVSTPVPAPIKESSTNQQAQAARTIEGYKRGIVMYGTYAHYIILC